MLKKILLTLFILLTAISSAGYYYVNSKIIDGEKQLAAGQQKYNHGEKMLKSGKQQLAAGKKQLTTAKVVYSGVSGGPLGDLTRQLPGTDICGDWWYHGQEATK